MLIAFEGPDGAGKTTLLTAVYETMRRQHIPAMAVAEFSDSPVGRRLLDALADDTFLRTAPNEPATAMTRALDVVADLYYLDEQVIGPALDCGLVVLKDRHLDTVLTTQAQALTAAGHFQKDWHALRWLAGLLTPLRWRPAVTVYVDAPEHLRMRRIAQRTQISTEDQAAEVSVADLTVLADRERLMAALMAAEPTRFLTVHNGHRQLEAAADDVLALITTRRGSTPVQNSEA